MPPGVEEERFVTNNPTSELTRGSDRWLAKIIAHELTLGLLTYEKILETFPPEDLMKGFKEEANRRADILGKCVGTKRNTALRLSPENAATNLNAALSEGDTTAQEILVVVGVDDLVRTQPCKRLWKLIREAGCVESDGDEHKRLLEHMICEAIIEKLAGASPETELSLVKGIGYKHFVSDNVPLKHRTAILERALHAEPFTAADLLKLMDPEVLTQHIPWQNLVKAIDELASLNQWLDTEDPEVVVIDDAALEELSADRADSPNTDEQAIELTKPKSQPPPPPRPPSSPPPLPIKADTAKE